MRFVQCWVAAFTVIIIANNICEALPLVPVVTYYDNDHHHLRHNYDESGQYHHDAHDHDNHHYDDDHHSQPHTATAECRLHLHSPKVDIVHQDDPYYHFYHPYDNAEQQVIRNTSVKNRPLIATQQYPYHNHLRNQQSYHSTNPYRSPGGTNAYQPSAQRYFPSNRYDGRYSNNGNNYDYYDRSSG